MASDAQSHRIVITHIGSLKIGLYVDGASEVFSSRPSDLRSSQPLVKGIDVEFVAGVVKHRDLLFMILDLDRILNRGERRALGPSGAERAPSDFSS